MIIEVVVIFQRFQLVKSVSVPILDHLLPIVDHPCVLKIYMQYPQDTAYLCEITLRMPSYFI